MVQESWNYIFDFNDTLLRGLMDSFYFLHITIGRPADRYVQIRYLKITISIQLSIKINKKYQLDKCFSIMTK